MKAQDIGESTTSSCIRVANILLTAKIESNKQKRQKRQQSHYPVCAGGGRLLPENNDSGWKGRRKGGPGCCGNRVSRPGCWQKWVPGSVQSRATLAKAISRVQCANKHKGCAPGAPGGQQRYMSNHPQHRQVKRVQDRGSKIKVRS